ncbi:FAD-dependent monooxygenase [Streptomyces otsuchiensis]|uniref:FAD-dependent monooxygenase n=1 Tax=Streptomyces otsuchiensis TaxID=2681388 RepID=UPI00102F96B8|nr:FAD-dependent monooxygenase [Streptomyces otsuchiensis]
MQPVIIVGAGPTGLALALALARQGVPSQVLDSGDGSVERRPARSCVLPPDIAHWGELPGALAQGARWAGWRTTLRGRVREHVPFTSRNAPLQLPLHALERALREETAGQRLIRITPHSRLSGVEQTERGVTAYVCSTRDGADPTREEPKPGSHLVGCDGARSTVRKLMRIPFTGRTSVERHAVAALRVDLPHRGEAALHRALPGVGSPAIDEVTVRPLADGRWRLDWPLLAGEELVTPDALLDLIHQTLAAWHEGTVPPYELLDTGVYLCHQRLARHWRAGRVFLAGDAAHLLGALGTQQTAEGLRDVDNLSWKLALDWHHGDAGALLDSYEDERRTAVGARLRAVDQALPLVRGRGGIGALLTGREQNRLTLLTDAPLNRGALGGDTPYPQPRPVRSLTVSTPPGAVAEDVAVTALDGTRGRLHQRFGGPQLLVLTAPGAGVWDSRHWLSAGLMPDLAATARTLPVEAELLVTDEYPGAPAHTLLVIRPDGRLAAALPGSATDELVRYAGSLRGPATDETATPAGRH